MEISMERLSTGKRINSAADDAAGIAIASRLTSEIRGTNQAIRNAMDAQGLIDTAEGAHDEIANILQRMREVAVQAINDTNSSKDRAALQTEMNQLKTEVDRIAHSTTWAGIQLLNGDATTAVATSTAGNKSVTFQVGSGTATSDSVNLTIGAMSAAKLSLGSTSSVSASFKSESKAANGTAAVSVGTVSTKGGFSVTASGGTITLTAATTAPTTAGDSGNEKVTITIEGTAVAFDVYDDAIAKGYSNTVASLTEALTQKN
jgi:flagellin